MDTPERALHALFDRLHAEPWDHDFFALLRRLDALQPDRPRLGRAKRPSQEAIRLGQEAELDFAPAALASFDYEGGAAPRLGVRLFGLLGPQGPMPLHLTEFVRERQRFRNDPTAARFLDLFHHRLLALFYRAWADSQPTVQADRPRDDRYASWLGSAAGLRAEAGGAAAGADRFDPAAGLSTTAQRFQTGLLSARSRHPEGLAKILADHFAVPVRIETHVPHRLEIEVEDRSRLGGGSGSVRGGFGQAAVLRRSATAGRRLCDRHSKFRVALGPLTLAGYLDFLPGGPAWGPLREWVRAYAGLDLRWDLQLGLAAAEVPAPRLGRYVRASGPGTARMPIAPPRRLRLGVTSWLGRAGGMRDPGAAADPRARDRADLRIRPETSFLLSPIHRRRAA